jgi:tetratricopeptide (TPR) repeat protein
MGGPGRALADLARAEVAVRRDAPETADSLLSAVLEARPDDRVLVRALRQRAALRLERVGDVEGAVADLRRLLELPGAPEVQAHELLARAHARRGELEQALEQLGALQGAVRRSGGGMHRSRWETVADAMLLGARILFWQRDDQAKAVLDTLLARPAGHAAENEALELLHLMTTAGDSARLDSFARADSLQFAGEDSAAADLYARLSGGEEALAEEAAWRSAFLRMERSGDPAPVVAFAEARPEAPRAQEAWLLLGQGHVERGDTAEAVISYERLLFGWPDGVLAATARLRLDRLEGMELPPLRREPEIEAPPPSGGGE